MTSALSEKWLVEINARAGAADVETQWPAQSWDLLRENGVLEWCIPVQYRGQERVGIDLLNGYERLAAHCLTTCFILSQRDAACRRIRDHGSPELCQELLPALAGGKTFATVGLSHLTTSRRHTPPSLRANETKDGFVLNGVMPWVTGAQRADHFVTGAVLEDGRQIMVAVPRHLDGLTIGPPLPLMALCGSLTAEVYCRHVKVDPKWLLAGPADNVMAAGRSGTGGLETSCLALGLADAAITYLFHEAENRAELRVNAESLEKSCQSFREEMHRLVQEQATAEAAMGLRSRANSLVLRSTQAALTASKGMGFLKNHPAQRWARQALFFLVWSCPRPAAEATLAYLTPAMDQVCP
jgi:alkylation response protein AidB-like acyl-CoA dehydrogenase